MCRDAYLLTSDIEEIYRKIKNSEKGMSSFIMNAKKVGTKIKSGPHSYYIYQE